MWVNKKPEMGDHIRVNRGFYYHHGIYKDDNCIYQFAAPQGSEISPENAIICTTTLELFLKGGELEVMEYNSEELKDKRKPKEIIACAKKLVGNKFGGYNIVTNNCEHFANYCVFGVKRSEQVENVLSALFGGMK